MEISKQVKSRRGNEYIIDLYSSSNELFYFTVKNTDNTKIQEGIWDFKEKYKGKNSLIESIKDIVSLVEDNFSDHETLKIFEEWDGIIN